MAGEEPVPQPAPSAGSLEPARPAADRPPLVDSPVAERWYEESGYTREDVLEAQAHLREQGYSPDQVEDPGNVRKVMPPRHASSLMPVRLEVPARARAGEPIPIRMEGRKPDPSFTFRRFSVLQQESLIRLRAVGHSDGLIAAQHEGAGETIAVDGELPPLSPGTYRVEIPELGPLGSFELVVE